MRCFISVDLPSELEGRIKNIQDRLKESQADINYVDPEKVHITLKFLGDNVRENQVSEIERRLNRAVSSFSSFSASIEKVGVFPNLDFIKVIWLGVERGEEKFKDLFREIEEEMTKFGFEEAEHEFTPHATIGRVNSGRNKDQLIRVLNNIEEKYVGEIEVNRIRLKKSELKPDGPEYSTLSEVKLS
ncbi:RNA 2',3'-cyclic phosphodiesterase [archaeon SCG-AAA382B04]|nr:RNA 2',3'-cyclic phosphodiesterase [archaeon SCG-AAA382B04]